MTGGHSFLGVIDREGGKGGGLPIPATQVQSTTV